MSARKNGSAMLKQQNFQAVLYPALNRKDTAISQKKTQKRAKNVTDGNACTGKEF